MSNSRFRTRRQALRDGAAVAGVAMAGTLLSTPAQAFNKRAFEAKTIQEAVRALGGGVLAESKDVSLQGPEISENGASVPVVAATTVAGAKMLVLLVDKNPSPLAATCVLHEALEPSFSTRIKMAQSSDVYAVAILPDGRALFARRDIKVTLGGCG